jgi:hypothetical protein
MRNKTEVMFDQVSRFDQVKQQANSRGNLGANDGDGLMAH